MITLTSLSLGTTRLCHILYHKSTKKCINIIIVKIFTENVNGAIINVNEYFFGEI